MGTEKKKQRQISFSRPIWIAIELELRSFEFNEVELKVHVIQMRTEIFTQVVQTERVSQTSRSVYLYGVSLRNAESYLLNQQKIFLKNNFRNQSEKIRWDSCVNGARLFTRNMQSTQPFQLK